MINPSLPGDEMMAVRVGAYKAHYWLWTEFKGKKQPETYFSFCQGQLVPNVTVHDQVIGERDLTSQIIMFIRDLGDYKS